MSSDDAKKYISDIVMSLDKKYDDFEIQFMGGEPLLCYSTIVEVSEWLFSKSWPKPLKNIFIVTNGTLLNQGNKQWFQENKDRVCLGLSFDGTMKMQNVNRSNSSDNIDIEFFSRTWPHQAVKMTVSPYTLKNLSQGIIFLHEKGFENIIVDLAMGNKIGWCANHLRILKQQLLTLKEFYLDNPQYNPCSLLRLDIFDLSKEGKCNKNCSCGEGLVCVDTEGNTYGCHLFSPIACDQELSSKSASIDFHDHSLFSDPKCDGCSLNRLCPRCYGMNYSQGRGLGEQDPFTCSSFKIIYLQNCSFQYAKAIREQNKDVSNAIKQILSNLNLTINQTEPI